MLIVAQIGHDAPVLTGVMEKSPAEEAGLQAGDRITRINGRHITAYRDIMLYTFSHPGQEMKVSFTRPGERGYGRKRWRDQRICYADPALQ